MIPRGIYDIAHDEHGSILQMDLLFSLPDAGEDR